MEENLETTIENLKIPDINASVSIDTKEFDISAIFERTHPSMNESEVPENSTSSLNKFETETIKDNQNVLEADKEGFSTNPVSGNTHPSEASEDFMLSMSELEAIRSNLDILGNKTEEFNISAIIDSPYPSMNVSEVLENIYPSMNASEVLENTHPSMNVSGILENIHPSMNVSGILENIHPSVNASEVLENTHPSMNVSGILENIHPSMNVSGILENIHPSVNASEVLENTNPSISAADARTLKNVTIEEITTTLSDENTLGQTESTSFSAVDMDVQLSNGTRGEATNGAIYEKTDGIPRKCQLDTDCSDLREPEAWSNLGSDEFWL
ncbi:unnamed protein product [Onchocerca flexuosa]|uniref:Clathrin_bdg domain-containing protein n=1 Tax=Onchocerca flexuosa TaxID=387005 RepID=A0A183HJX4_9BILA|nr:unnamed protein product [Onchocerca flexuosa]